METKFQSNNTKIGIWGEKHIFHKKILTIKRILKVSPVSLIQFLKYLGMNFVIEFQNQVILMWNFYLNLSFANLWTRLNWKKYPPHLPPMWVICYGSVWTITLYNMNDSIFIYCTTLFHLFKFTQIAQNKLT